MWLFTQHTYQCVFVCVGCRLYSAVYFLRGFHMPTIFVFIYSHPIILPVHSVPLIAAALCAGAFQHPPPAHHNGLFVSSHPPDPGLSVVYQKQLKKEFIAGCAFCARLVSACVSGLRSRPCHPTCCSCVSHRAHLCLLVVLQLRPLRFATFPPSASACTFCVHSHVRSAHTNDPMMLCFFIVLATAYMLYARRSV